MKRETEENWNYWEFISGSIIHRRERVKGRAEEKRVVIDPRLADKAIT
jgi:hypothetical protein